MHSNVSRVIDNRLTAVWIRNPNSRVSPHGSSMTFQVMGVKMPDCCDVTCSITQRIIVAALRTLQQHVSDRYGSYT